MLATGEVLSVAGTLTDPASSRMMVLRTTRPGVQIHICNYPTDKVAAKAGHRMTRYGGLTFETQKFPGSPNHAHFPACILHPGETCHHVMALAFSTDGGEVGNGGPA